MSNDYSKIHNTTKFIKNIPGAKSRIKDVVSNIGSNGDLREAFGIDAVLKSIIVALTTVKGTYPFDPNFGLGIQKYLFELTTMETQEKIEREVILTIYEYEPRAKATVKVSFFDDMSGFQINIVLKIDDEQRTTNLVVEQSGVRLLNVL